MAFGPTQQEAAANLLAAAQALGLTPDPKAIQRLLQYLGLLQRWNKVYNLTAVRGAESMLTLHLVDCLAAVPAIARQVDPAQPHGAGDAPPAPGTEPFGTPSGDSRATPASNDMPGRRPQLLDVGSGGGLPGVVLAILRPGWDVHCVDAVAKKVSFIRQVALELALPNLKASHQRVEPASGPLSGRLSQVRQQSQMAARPEKPLAHSGTAGLADGQAAGQIPAWVPPGRFDLIVSRAFASLRDFTALTRRLLGSRGVWVAMKAHMVEAELNAIPDDLQVFHVEQLTVPGLDAQRCLVWIRPKHG